MTLLDELLPLEEGFWRAAGDEAGYAAGVAPDAVHVFPGWGVSGWAATRPRWSTQRARRAAASPSSRP